MGKSTILNAIFNSYVKLPEVVSYKQLLNRYSNCSQGGFK